MSRGPGVHNSTRPSFHGGRAVVAEPAANCWIATVVVGGVFWLCGSATSADDATATPPPAAATAAQLTPAQRQERLKERDRIRQEAKQLYLAGKYDEAIAAAEKSLAIEREVLGGDHPDAIGSLQNLAILHQAKGDFTGARALGEELLAAKTKLMGKDHWQVTNARLDLAEADVFARLTPEDRQALSHCDELSGKAMKLASKGGAEQALPLAKEVLEIRTRLLGPKHRSTVLADFWLGTILADLRQFTAAEPHFQRIVHVNKEILGEKHPNYASSMIMLAKLYENMDDYAKAEPLYQKALLIQRDVLGENHPDYLTSVNNLGGLYSAMGNYAEAESLYRQVVQIRKVVLGERHPDYATSLTNLAANYHKMGQFAKAEPLYRQAVQIRRDAIGENHVDYANSLNNLAVLYNDMGEFAKAEPLCRQALKIHKDLLGETHPLYALSLGTLASLYEAESDYAKAEPLRRQALQILRAASGEKHLGSDYAKSLSSLASLYTYMGDYAKAEPLYRQALPIFKEALGEKHPDYATSLINQGLVYKNLRDYAKAEPVFLQALQIHQEALGEKHPACAADLAVLAAFYYEVRDYEKAGSFYRKSSDIYRETLGSKHPAYAESLNLLGVLCTNMGEYEQAEQFFRQAIVIQKEVFGEKNPVYANSLSNLASLYDVSGQSGKAVPLSREALQIAREQSELTAAIQSERQQEAMRLMVWQYLDRYLHATAKSGVPAEEVYTDVLHWKGEVAGRQRRLRQAQRQLAEGNDKAAAKLAAELTDATGSLARLYRSNSANNPHRDAQLAELSDRVEALQQQLSGINVEFRLERDQQRRTPDEIRKALPADAVLIDLLGNMYFQPASEKGKRGTWCSDLIAFVVRAGQPVERVELGPAEPIQQAIEHWRRSFGAKTGGDDPGAQLRKLLWHPLEKYVAGAKTVLISPNSTTAPLPWAALPGNEQGSYLIDDVAIAVLPIPALLPELVAGDKAAEPMAKNPSLLLVGDVDFGADPGSRDTVSIGLVAARGGQQFNWPALPGTRDEVSAVQASFAKQFGGGVATELTRDRATKSAVRKEAGQHEYLHFSTHGFFAPPELKSAEALGANGGTPAARQNVSGFQPGLLSGLVLAGANQPYEDGKEDGILTALEVAEMDLSHVRLATLSACETGLGQSAGAEGLLGLQRAFQTAGAKTVVASLWTVPDKATQMLMARFYDNLWRKKMSKLEALREAQRWMLHEGPKEPGLARGLQFATETPDESDKSGTLPPYYWAAFVLSGDWR
jgi:CHAT domain-containing protein/Tfp pilus assembly protein PilF